jgi:Tol biopolymer transport system component
MIWVNSDLSTQKPYTMKNILLYWLIFLGLASIGCSKENVQDNPEEKSTFKITKLLPLSDNIPYQELGSGKIFFERTYAQGGSSFYMIDIDNKESSGFQMENKLTQPSISPDGTKIACSLLNTGDADATWSIYIMNTDGSECFPAYISDKPASFPTWNSDGSKIIFYTGGEDGRLYRQSPLENASDREELAKFSYDDDPDWLIKPVGGFSVSPSGKMISVSISDKFFGLIDLVPYSGKEGVTVMFAPSPELYIESVESPVFSPDGSKIAFLSTYKDKNIPGYLALIINTMNADGSSYNPRGGMGGYEPNLDLPRYTSLCWSPDATKILFAMPDIEGTCHLYVFNLDSTGFFKVTNQLNIFDSNVSWSR